MLKNQAQGILIYYCLKFKISCLGFVLINLIYCFLFFNSSIHAISIHDRQTGSDTTSSGLMRLSLLPAMDQLQGDCRAHVHECVHRWYALISSHLKLDLDQLQGDYRAHVHECVHRWYALISCWTDFFKIRELHIFRKTRFLKIDRFSFHYLITQRNVQNLGLC